MKKLIACTMSAAIISGILLTAGCGGNTTSHTETQSESTQTTTTKEFFTTPSPENGLISTDDSGMIDGDPDDSSEPSENATSPPPSDNTEDLAYIKPAGFEDLDFGGKTFVIATTSGTDPRWETTKEIYSDEPNAISTATRERNKLVETLYHCKIEVKDSENADALTMSEVTSGKHTIDIFSAKGLGKTPSEQGNIYNLYQLGIDFSHEWWDPAFVSAYTVKTASGINALYALMGDFCLSSFAATHAILFNKDLMASAPITENVYDLVKNHAWTMDKFAEMIRLSARDSSGNSVYSYTEGDILGWARTGHATHGLHTASALPIIANINQTFSFQPFNNAAAWTNIIDKAIEIWNLEGAETLGYTDVQAALTSGKALFASEVLDVLERMKNTENVSIGLLPYPLYNESQSAYSHYVDNHVFTYHVPTSVSETSEIGNFLEVFGYHSRHTVRKAFIDTYSYEYCGDAESAEMLNLILNSRSYDPGYHFWNAFESDLSQMIASSQNNIAKWAERKNSTAEGDITSYMTKISENPT